MTKLLDCKKVDSEKGGGGYHEKLVKVKLWSAGSVCAADYDHLYYCI